MLYYKFLKEKDGKIVSSYGDFEWGVGKEYSVTGKIQTCNRPGLTNGLHASKMPLNALYYVKGTIIAMVEASGDSDNSTDKICVRTMKIVKAYKWTALDSVALAIYSAELVIKIYEDMYPDDTRPRDAIKAAKAYLRDPSEKHAKTAAYAAYKADAAYAAAGAAYASYAAARAARAAADAAYASYAAARAARAARTAADAAYAADAAARAASYAADAAADAEIKINRWIKRRIKKLEEIK